MSKITKYNNISVVYNCDHLKAMVVYMITFPNNKRYIGQTINSLYKRISAHCSDKEAENNIYKYNALQKYQSIVVDILFEGTSIDELNEYEKIFINQYNTIDKEMKL